MVSSGHVATHGASMSYCAESGVGPGGSVRPDPPQHRTRRYKAQPESWKAESVGPRPCRGAAFLTVAATDTLTPLWHLLALEGTRRGEALGLRWQDVNWEVGAEHISQTVAPGAELYDLDTFDSPPQRRMRLVAAKSIRRSKA